MSQIGRAASGDCHSPGLTNRDPIVLERGLTQDHTFEAWGNLVGSATTEISLKNYRKDVRIELENEQGVTVMAYNVLRCWVSEYVALGQLDSESETTLIESLTLEHEGWQRDTSVVEPAET